MSAPREEYQQDGECSCPAKHTETGSEEERHEWYVEEILGALADARARNPAMGPNWDAAADAAIAVADKEIAALPVYAYDGPDLSSLEAENARLRAVIERVRAAAKKARRSGNMYDMEDVISVALEGGSSD